MVALLVVAIALGLNNFGAAIAIGVGGVDRRTGSRWPRSSACATS